MGAGERSPEVVAIERYGSLDGWYVAARSDPVYGEAIRKIETSLGWLYNVPSAAGPELGALHAAELQAQLRSLRVAMLDTAPAGAGPTHPGGAPNKEWPALAVQEATRLWTTGAYARSRTRIAEHVTQTVIERCRAEDLIGHGWVEKPFKFTPYAMGQVVEAVGSDLLAWDDETQELGVRGVFRRFSATDDWLPIPRAEPAS